MMDTQSHNMYEQLLWTNVWSTNTWSSWNIYPFYEATKTVALAVYSV